MVVIYDTKYPKENKIDDTEKYDFELDHFQKYALQTINADKHVLITAHTGSGKTLPAEYGVVPVKNQSWGTLFLYDFFAYFYSNT